MNNMFVDEKISKLVGSNDMYKDVVGVEIELEHVEGIKELTKDLHKHWKMEHDGSLRINGAEYVFLNPLSVDKAHKAVKDLGKHIDSYTKPVNQGRDGVHVHINVGDLTVRQMVNFITLWHSVEPLVTNWCGKYRNGNLFCLGLGEAEYIADVLVEALEKNSLRKLHTDKIRYSAINLKAVPQYGSVEFRCMRSDGNWEDINKFIDLVIHLKTIARDVDSPVQLVAESSIMGCEGFIPHILGEFNDMLPKYEGWEDDVYYNIRRAQSYAYCREW
jgi:hypothetical protein